MSKAAAASSAASSCVATTAAPPPITAAVRGPAFLNTAPGRRAIGRPGTFLWAKKKAEEEDAEEEELGEDEDGEWEYEYVYEDDEGEEAEEEVEGDEDDGGAAAGPDDAGVEEEEVFHDEVDEVYAEDDDAGDAGMLEADDDEDVAEAGTLEAEYDDAESGGDDDDDVGVVAAAVAEAPQDDEPASDLDYVEDDLIPLQDPTEDDGEAYAAQRSFLDEEVPRLDYVSKSKDNILRSKVEQAGIPGSWEKTYDDVFAEFLTKKEILEAEKKADAASMSEEDIKKIADLSGEMAEATEELDALEGSDAFPPDGPDLASRGYTNADLVEIDRLSRESFSISKAMEDGTWEGYTRFDLIDPEEGWDRLNLTDPVQFDECETVLEEMDDDDRPIYHPEKMLLYDLNFDVYNLMLAAFKHNPDAPVILPQWLYQVECYSKYRHVQDAGFTIDWDEADKIADAAELGRYWKGLGYDEIPKQTSQETNIVKIEKPDDDDYQIAHLQEWMKEVYDPKFDEVFFDDDSFMPYDSVFSDEFYNKDPPKDQVELEKLLKEFKADAQEAGNLTSAEEVQMQEFMDGMVSMKNFTSRVEHDSPEASDFRGHLVVACGTSDADLEVAEAITLRFESEFGRKVFVESRVYKHAKDEDYLFEVWLEGFDIDLLHSKRRATFGSAQWDGPAECDEGQIEYLVDEVTYLISDDHRFSYRLFEYEGIDEG